MLTDNDQSIVMKTTFLKSHGQNPLLATALLLLMTLGTDSHAGIRLEMTSSDIPAYSHFEAHLLHTDGEWVAIPFFRPPDCIRPDFNFLDFFDFAAFACSPPVPILTGFGIWSDDAIPLLEPPLHSSLQLTPGQTAPVWFVRLTELQAAIADGVMTIGELAALPSLLVGAADFFTEAIHPLDGGQQPMLSIVASGYLEDGRTFTYSAAEAAGLIRDVLIRFR